MSRLLDPMHRRHFEELGLEPDARTLEVGCGNGSMSIWLASRLAPGGRAVAVDLDLSLASADVAGLEFRQADILAGAVEPGGFDLVTARAVLHHVADAEAAVVNLIASARPGGAVLLIEPDFLPTTIAEPPAVREFWTGWLAWSREQGIDYFVGRRLMGTCPSTTERTSGPAGTSRALTYPPPGGHNLPGTSTGTSVRPGIATVSP
jgi:SAM-dependent methyltransferase